MSGELTYTDSSIDSKTGPELVRHRASFYMTTIDDHGIAHLVREIVDNSIDELANTKSKLHETRLILIRDNISKRFMFTVVDSGRGIPQKKMKDAMITLHTSGKYDSNAYQQSAGLYGVGSTVAFSLSKQARYTSVRDNTYADLKMNYLDYHSQETVFTKKSDKHMDTGSIVTLEPDYDFFENTSVFMNETWKVFDEAFKIITLFNPYNLYIHILDVDTKEYDELRNNLFFTLSPKDLINYLYGDLFKQVKHIHLSPGNKTDKERFLKEMFKVESWKNVLRLDTGPKDKDGVSVQMSVYLNLKTYDVTKSAVSNVNNIIMKNYDDVHIACIADHLKGNMVKYIQNKEIAKYFIEEYRLPLNYVTNINMNDAQYAGNAKDRFRDTKFKAIFSKMLIKHLKKHTDDIFNLYNLLEKNIIAEFNNQSNISVSKSGKLLHDLNYPSKYNDCISNGEDAELIIVEGESAKEITARDSEFQAIYNLKGKPLNPVDTEETKHTSIRKMMRNPIIQDIVTVLGIKPNDKTLEGLRFNKVFITTDADEHGNHIANIILGILWLYNEHLIRKGHVYIVQPPHVKITMSKNNIIYADSEEELYNVLTDTVFIKNYSLSIIKNKVVSSDLSAKDTKKYIRECMSIGKRIHALAEEYSVSMSAIESYLTYLMYTRLNETIPDDTKAMLNIHDVSVNDDMYMISTRDADEYIYNNTNTSVNELLTDYINFTKDVDMYHLRFINSDKDDVQGKITMLYKIIESIKNKASYKKLKGIGSMDPSEILDTCTDPEGRSTVCIKKVGDYKAIYNYLGSDSSYRKKLVSEL